MSGSSDRREFLQAGALAGVGFWVAGSAQAEDKPAVRGEEKPGEKLRVACIGVGGKGQSDTEQAGKFAEIVALCDIDESDRGLGGRKKQFPKAKVYFDYRKMLQEIGKEIDAVTVSTPDHTHAPAAIMAMKMGKHVYCQKPLTHTVSEARRMREVAHEQKVCTQMGNQGTASGGLRSSVEIIQSGALGEIKEVHVWTNRPVWPQAPEITTRLKEEPIPKHIHWDLFLGTAPMRPYNHGYTPFNWRGWWDFGTGALGDMACHTCNLPFMALRLGFPTSVIGESGPLNTETYPAWSKVVYQFPARNDGGKMLPPVTLTWYEGRVGGKSRSDGKRVLPPAELLQGYKGGKFSDSGSLIVGKNGTLYSPDDYGASRVLLPTDKFKYFVAPKQTLRRHKMDDDTAMKFEWMEAIRNKDPKLALSNFDYAAMLTEAILLGNVAVRVPGKVLEWNGPAMKFTNSSDANKFLSVEYRTGWTV